MFRCTKVKELKMTAKKKLQRNESSYHGEVSGRVGIDRVKITIETLAGNTWGGSRKGRSVHQIFAVGRVVEKAAEKGKRKFIIRF